MTTLIAPAFRKAATRHRTETGQGRSQVTTALRSS
jgi:hypothetical protein